MKTLPDEEAPLSYWTKTDSKVDPEVLRSCLKRVRISEIIYYAQFGGIRFDLGKGVSV